MKALVYTGTQELVYRDVANPSEVSGESILQSGPTPLSDGIF